MLDRPVHLSSDIWTSSAIHPNGLVQGRPAYPKPERPEEGLGPKSPLRKQVLFKLYDQLLPYLGETGRLLKISQTACSLGSRAPDLSTPTGHLPSNSRTMFASLGNSQKLPGKKQCTLSTDFIKEEDPLPRRGWKGG